MQKLIDKFLATGSMADARKLVKHDMKHMMAACMLDEIGQAALRAAHNMVAQDETGA